MTSLHVICGLGPPNQKSWLRLRYRPSQLPLSTCAQTFQLHTPFFSWSFPTSGGCVYAIGFVPFHFGTTKLVSDYVTSCRLVDSLSFTLETILPLLRWKVSSRTWRQTILQALNDQLFSVCIISLPTFCLLRCSNLLFLASSFQMPISKFLKILFFQFFLSLTWLTRLFSSFLRWLLF